MQTAGPAARSPKRRPRPRAPAGAAAASSSCVCVPGGGVDGRMNRVRGSIGGGIGRRRIISMWVAVVDVDVLVEARARSRWPKRRAARKRRRRRHARSVFERRRVCGCAWGDSVNVFSSPLGRFTLIEAILACAELDQNSIGRPCVFRSLIHNGRACAPPHRPTALQQGAPSSAGRAARARKT